MKTLITALCLLLASTVVGAGEVGYEVAEDCIQKGTCTILLRADTCPNGFELKDGECVPKKGHCPICGAKGMITTLIYDDDNTIHYILYLCPNHHVFWSRR